MSVEMINVGDTSLVWSSGAFALSVLGASVVVMSDSRRAGRIPLAAVFIMLGGLASLPLVATFAPALLFAFSPLLFALLFALPAALWFYVRALTRAQPLHRIRLHLIFPASGVAIAAGFWMLPADAQRMMLVEGNLPQGYFPAVLALTTFVLVLLWNAVSLGYLIAITRRLTLYRKRLRDLYSNLAAREYLWINWFIATLVALWAMAAAAVVMDNLADRSLFDMASISAGTAFLLLFLCIWSLRDPGPDGEGADEEFGPDTGVKMDQVKVTTRETPKAEKYDRSALTEDQAQRISDRICAAMESDRLFLDPNLTLQKLASHVATSPNLVSQTLNDTIGETFFDHVNRWRVEAAKPLLLNDGGTVLAIAIDVGFNSKSTFYKAFRNVTGKAPGLWRRVANSRKSN